MTLRAADAQLFEELDRHTLGGRDVEPVEETAVDLETVARVGPSGEAFGRFDGANYGQAVRLGEREVALVLGGHGHDRPGAVAHEHVVGHVDRHELVVEGIHAVAAREGAPLLERSFGRLALDVGGLPGAGAQLGDLVLVGIGHELGHERVLGREHGVGHAEAGVRARREDLDLDAGPAGDCHAELSAFGATDPVALHRLDALGPVEAVEGIQQLLGVLGDAEEPLLEVAAFDDVAGALAGAVGEDLFVGEHGVASGTPVDRCLGAVGEAGAEQFEEYDLVPAHVVRVVAAQFAPPVVDRAQSLHRGLELSDAGLGVHAGVVSTLYGGVLGGQAERVEAEGAQYGVALHRSCA